MSNIKALFSSDNTEWSTPQDFFDEIDEEFHFTLDPCAQPHTAKCSKYYTREDDGLAQDWGGRQCSATLLMAKPSPTGYASVVRRARNLIPS
jgi:phage N-6-adenine-methyltransferase